MGSNNTELDEDLRIKIKNNREAKKSSNLPKSKRKKFEHL